MYAINKLISLLCAPGVRRAVDCAAPTQKGTNIDHVEDEAADGSVEIAKIYAVIRKPRRLDRWLDSIVAFSGSEYMFFAIAAVLLVWAFLGIPFGHATDWQVGRL